MSSLTRPRGPLPKGVYWRRRLLVVGLAALLVLGLGRALGGGSDGRGAEEAADLTGGSPTGAPPASRTSGAAADPSGTPGTSAPAAPRGSGTGTPSRPATTSPTPTPEPLADPTGPCRTGQLVVTPTVHKVVAQAGVTLRMTVRTTQEACTWDVSSKTLAVRITSGDDRIWSSVDCPTGVREQTVVVRRALPADLAVRWSGRRSDEGCSRFTSWARLGWYHVEAAPVGGEPVDDQFELVKPPTVTVTRSPSPSPTPRPSRKASPSATASR